MERLLKHRLLVLGVALALTASAGGAYAATQSASSSRPAFLNDVARRLGVSPSQLRSALRGALLDRLNAAVKDGELTRAQADQIRRRIEENGALAFAGPMWRRGFGPPGYGPRGFGPPAFGPPGYWPRGFAPPGPGLARRSLLPAAASYLGLSPAQLLSHLRNGKTLAQIAQDQNKPVSGLEQALMSAAKARLDRLVAAKQLTKAEEQRRLNRLSSRIDRLVNHARLEHYGSADGPPANLPRGPASGAPGIPVGPPPAG